VKRKISAKQSSATAWRCSLTTANADASAVALSEPYDSYWVVYLRYTQEVTDDAGRDDFPLFRELHRCLRLLLGRRDRCLVVLECADVDFKSLQEDSW
jgi:hypothetical protein